MTGALEKLTILNTRPKSYAQEMNHFIEQHGGHCLDFPTIDIVPTDCHNWQAKLTPATDIALFISPNAVSLSLAYLKNAYPVWPIVGAVGLKTRDRLIKEQIDVELIGKTFDSEGLLALKPLNQVQNKTIAIFKGKGGRTLLKETLCQRGANVIEYDVYQRQIPPKGDHKNLWKNTTIDIILGTSVEACDNLFQLVEKSEVNKLRHATWLVKSERIKKQCQKHHIQNIIIANKGDIYTGLLNIGKTRREFNHGNTKDQN